MIVWSPGESRGVFYCITLRWLVIIFEGDVLVL